MRWTALAILVVAAISQSLRAQSDWERSLYEDIDIQHAIMAGEPWGVAIVIERRPEVIHEPMGPAGILPLQIAVILRRQDMAELLLASGAEPDIFCAAGLGRIEDIERIQGRPAVEKAPSCSQ